MIILIVDDSVIKINKIKVVINETKIFTEFLIARNKADAMNLILSNPSIDLMILDLNLPNRKEEKPKRLAGLSLLRELNRRSSISKPKYIIGLTAYSELKNETVEEFEQNGWVIITYNNSSAKWEEIIKNKINYISTNNSNIAPKRTIKEKISDNWLALSTIAGLSAMITTYILLYFPFNLFSVSFLVGVLVFSLVLFKNPKYFYRRILSYLIGSFIIIASMPIIEFQHSFSENSFAKLAAQKIDKWFYIVFVIVSIALVIADLISNGEKKS